jgi:hypothetical protein
MGLEMLAKYNESGKCTAEPVLYTDASLHAPVSQSGYLLVWECPLGSEMPGAWRSVKQPISADSSGASELIAAHLGVRDCLTKVEDSLLMKVDNSAVLRNSKRGGDSSSLSWLSKALRLRMELLHDLSQLGIVKAEYVNTLLMRADPLTKAITTGKIALARQHLCIR